MLAENIPHFHRGKLLFCYYSLLEKLISLLINIQWIKTLSVEYNRIDDSRYSLFQFLEIVAVVRFARENTDVRHWSFHYGKYKNTPSGL